jgi:hypothetical protein
VTTPTVQPAVELSDQQANYVFEGVGGRELLFIRWKVKYRFTQGQPHPQHWYACQVTFSPGGIELEEVPGQQVQAQGTLEGKSAILHGMKLPRSATFSLSVGQRKGAYQRIGKEVQCPVSERLVLTTPEQEDVVARITSLGGKVGRAGGRPGAVVMVVSLRGKKPDRTAIADLKKLTSLRQLDFSATQASDDDLTHLANLTGLTLLGIHDNPRITDTGLARLAKLTNLQQFTFSRTGVTDAGLAHLKGMTKLVQVYAGCKGMGNAGLVHLQALPELRSLALGQSQVTDAGLAHLKGMTKLEFLVLDNTKITNAGLAQLGGLTNLGTLRIVGTRVTAAGVMKLQNALPKVKIVTANPSNKKQEAGAGPDAPAPVPPPGSPP